MADSTTLDLSTLDAERRELLETLRLHRSFLLKTVQSLSDEQATSRPTVSELTLGGIVKHVAATEQAWIDFTQRGAAAMDFDFSDPQVVERLRDEWRLVDGETLDMVIQRYKEVPKPPSR